jgi:hypothetical protein
VRKTHILKPLYRERYLLKIQCFDHFHYRWTMLFLVTLVTWAVVPQSATLHYDAVFPSVMLPSFGFQANGSFEMSIASSELGSFVLLFQHVRESSYISAMRPKQLLHFCHRPLPASFLSHRFAGDSINDHAYLNGTIAYDGIYTPYLINCEFNRTKYEVNVSYTNPTSHLDSRTMFLDSLYRYLSIIYFTLALVWMLNGCRFSMFRVPLHTVFTVLPIIRGLSSLFISWVWQHRAVTGQGSAFEDVIFLLDFVYYTLYLSAIAFVGTGWCIFRGAPEVGQISRILSSSLLPTLGVMLIPFAREFIEILPLLALLVLGLMLYAKINVYNIILVVRLLDSMTKRPLVANKIKLAKKYVIQSFLHLIGTVAGTAALIVIDGSATYATVFFEALFLLGSLMHMQFFLFRKRYAGEAPGHDRVPNMQRLRPKPTVLVGPARNVLVLAQGR